MNSAVGRVFRKRVSVLSLNLESASALLQLTELGRVVIVPSGQRWSILNDIVDVPL